MLKEGSPDEARGDTHETEIRVGDIEADLTIPYTDRVDDLDMILLDVLAPYLP